MNPRLRGVLIAAAVCIVPSALFVVTGLWSMPSFRETLYLGRLPLALIVYGLLWHVRGESPIRLLHSLVRVLVSLERVAIELARDTPAEAWRRFRVVLRNEKQEEWA